MIQLTEITHKLFNYKTVHSILYRDYRLNNLVIPKRKFYKSYQLEKLQSRSLLKVSGDDVLEFMQGLITNDIRHLENGPKCLYTMFLNNKGRVMFDSIIYSNHRSKDLLIECDSTAIDLLEKHLKLFRVHRKINLEDINDEYQVWVLFNPTKVTQLVDKVNNGNSFQELIVPCTVPLTGTKQEFVNDLLLDDDICLYPDPRIPELGLRVIVKANKNIREAVKNSGINVLKMEEMSYTMFRFALGVAEGVKELPLAKCFPLEANCDYLHGVSFHKGCYIGQELTARTHHTGVVRKRLMPLILTSEVSPSDLQVDAPIEDGAGKLKINIGKLRGSEKNFGIGLMRITEALESSKLKIGTINAHTIKPFWWPQESPKEHNIKRKD